MRETEQNLGIDRKDSPLRSNIYLKEEYTGAKDRRDTKGMRIRARTKKKSKGSKTILGGRNIKILPYGRKGQKR